jgi:hypothetical protein
MVERNAHTKPTNGASMSPEAITIIALLAVLLGVAILGVVQLAVIISQLADLKAYTQTQISLLQGNMR